MMPAARPRKNQTAAPIIIRTPAMIDGCTAIPKPARSDLDFFGLEIGFDTEGFAADTPDFGICGAEKGFGRSWTAGILSGSGETVFLSSGVSADRIFSASSSTSFSCV
ncbi:MAG TPA: hypothetical protein VKE98_10170 [Gemmataceae bacterium]|nr:hypothetical protein [Gemmataceae bacterium]